MLNTNKLNFYKYIENTIKNKHLSHAYLIEISNYEEDFNDILNFVKIILCKREILDYNKLNCNKCNICSLVDSNNYPDLYIIEPDGSNIKKEQVLLLEDEFKNKSILDNKRIYIIKEAEKLNDYSANTMLKFLEEPSSDIIAILLTTNRFKIIKTILSRCQFLSIKSNLDFNIDDYYYDFCKYLVNGYDLFINYNDILDNLFIEEDKINRDKIYNFFNNLSSILLSYYKYVEFNIDIKDKKIIDIFKDIDSNKIFNMIEIINNNIGDLNYNINIKIWLDSIYSELIGGIYD